MSGVWHTASVLVVAAYAAEDVVPEVEALRSTMPEPFAVLLVGPVSSAVNGYAMYALLPSGSKSGWPDAVEWGRWHWELQALARRHAHPDGSNPCSMVSMAWDVESHGLHSDFPPAARNV